MLIENETRQPTNHRIKKIAVIATFLPLLVQTEPFEESRLEKEVLVTDCSDAVQVEADQNGDVHFIERSGNLRIHAPATKASRVAGVVPFVLLGDGGLTGFALFPDFTGNGWIYFYYGPKEEPRVMRVSRFTLGADGLSDEKILLSFTGQGANLG